MQLILVSTQTPYIDFFGFFLALSEMEPRDVPLVPLHVQCT